MVILKLHTVATDHMLDILSRGAASLVSLDISFSKHVTDAGVENLCGPGSCLTLKLRQILLDGTSVTSKSVLSILENFPNLVNIDSSLMEKFLLSMQTFFQESTSTGTKCTATIKIVNFD